MTAQLWRRSSAFRRTIETVVEEGDEGVQVVDVDRYLTEVELLAPPDKRVALMQLGLGRLVASTPVLGS